MTGSQSFKDICTHSIIWGEQSDRVILELILDKLPYLQMEVYNTVLGLHSYVKPEFMYYYVYKTLFANRALINDYPFVNFIHFLRMMPAPTHCIIDWHLESHKVNDNVKPEEFCIFIMDFTFSYDFDQDFERLALAADPFLPAGIDESFTNPQASRTRSKKALNILNETRAVSTK